MGHTSLYMQQYMHYIWQSFVNNFFYAFSSNKMHLSDDKKPKTI